MQTTAFSGDRAALYEEDRRRRRKRELNVGMTERVATAIAGGILVGYGAMQRGPAGIVAAAGGAGLLARAATGYCPVYRALGVGRRDLPAAASVAHGRGKKIETTVVINRPREELYEFWRNLENLPRFMRHLQSVQNLGNDRSHWVVTAPGGATVEWDAEIYNEIRPELLAWRSVGDSEVNHAGSVHFTPAGDRRTEVRVALNYEPPAGRLGVALARFLGEEPEQQIEDDLNSLRQLMEAGEIPATLAPPAGTHLPGPGL
jgi:uncharacterized membrane protein